MGLRLLLLLFCGDRLSFFDLVSVNKRVVTKDTEQPRPHHCCALAQVMCLKPKVESVLSRKVNMMTARSVFPWNMFEKRTPSCVYAGRV